MGAFEKFTRWLNGSFTCRKCGHQFNTMTFGYGTAVCPQCYRGEEQFIFFDQSYWLNRIMAKLVKHQEEPKEEEPYDPLLMVQDYMPEIPL
jgi:hypothetical protein